MLIVNVSVLRIKCVRELEFKTDYVIFLFKADTSWPAYAKEIFA